MHMQHSMFNDFASPLLPPPAYDLSTRESGKKPQTLLFSATVPSWVRNIANKYLETDKLEEVDLVGEGGNQTSTTVDHLAVRCVAAARPGRLLF